MKNARLLFIILLWLLTNSALSYDVNRGNICNEAGQPIQLRGINWFGFEAAALWQAQAVLTPECFENPKGCQESPSQGSYESGIGLIRGWVCDANRVEVQIDDGERRLTGYGTKRGDTQEICGDVNNGYGLTFNWNQAGDGLHTLRTFVDGEEKTSVIFNVTTLGVDYLRGKQGKYVLVNFPYPGRKATVIWSEPHQNFVITTPGANDNLIPTPECFENPKGCQESPSQGSYESGIGLIRGWVCDANRVEVQIDDGERRLTGYGTKRGDTQEICGDVNNGYGLTFNWNQAGDGLHTLRTFVDGEEKTSVIFNVATLGKNYLQDVSGEYRLPDFPDRGRMTIRWSEPHQNFVIVKDCSSCTILQEAENWTTCTGGAKVTRSNYSSNAGWHFYQGQSASYTIQVPAAPAYNLIAHYGNDGLPDKVTVLVNGEMRGSFDTQDTRPPGGEPGSGWNQPALSSPVPLGNAHLEPTITLHVDSADEYGVEIDSFFLVPMN